MTPALVVVAVPPSASVMESVTVTGGFVFEPNELDKSLRKTATTRLLSAESPQNPYQKLLHHSFRYRTESMDLALKLVVLHTPSRSNNNLITFIGIV